MGCYRVHRSHYLLLAFVVIVGVAGVLWLLGWSFWPFGKRYVPDYYFIQLHEHHKNYFPEGERLVLLNGIPVDSLQEKSRVGVARATRIMEYSSSAAIERFGDVGRYGATEIVGEEVEWIVSDIATYQQRYNPAMMFTHTGVSLPDRRNPGDAAVLVAGEAADTLYLGATRYRHVVLDTIEKVMVSAFRMFHVNSYKRKWSPDRPLLIFRYGRQEALFVGVNVEGAGEGLYTYDDRVVAFGRWVDNTVSAVMKRRRKTGKVNDSRLVVTNGDVQEQKSPLSRIQATQGTVTYLNGIDGVKMYGWKGYAGAVAVTGNTLKFFGQAQQ